ncbi:MAG: hypothetical protein RLZZ511_409 [Cyanobacteriota bacterium]|jgi:hypothetical protein
MEQPALPTELILTQSQQAIGKVELDWSPQPGAYLDFDGQTYKVLERRHRYHLRSGRYRLHQMLVYVQTAERPTEQSLVRGRWVIGDANCAYNAQSELLRCAINPTGPCAGCSHYTMIAN